VRGVRARLVTDRFGQAVRCRPLSSAERRSGDREILAVSKAQLVEVHDPELSSLSESSDVASYFWFDESFGPAATQQDVHMSVGRWAIKSFWDGYPTSIVSGPGVSRGRSSRQRGSLSQLAYGPTGSGKTFTTFGPQGAPVDSDVAGLVPRILQDLFRRLRKDARRLGHSIPDSDAGVTIIPEHVTARVIEHHPALSHSVVAAEILNRWPAYGVASVRASFVEIYSERIFDLLSESTGDGASETKRVASKRDVWQSPVRRPGAGLKGTAGPMLRVRERASGSTFVEGATVVSVGSWTDVETLLERGYSRRAVAETAANMESSRSHAVFSLEMIRRDVSSEFSETSFDERAIKCKLVVVDLAGSESARTTSTIPSRFSTVDPGVKQARALEAKSINQSLSALGSVISTLAATGSSARKSKKESYIPYRNSVLTWLLKECIGGRARTLMLANVSPSPTLYHDTIAALRYVQAARNIAVDSKARSEMTQSIMERQRERSSLAMRSMGRLPQEAAEVVEATSSPPVPDTVPKDAWVPPSLPLDHELSLDGTEAVLKLHIALKDAHATAADALKEVQRLRQLVKELQHQLGERGAEFAEVSELRRQLREREAECGRLRELATRMVHQDTSTSPPLDAMVSTDLTEAFERVSTEQTLPEEEPLPEESPVSPERRPRRRTGQLQGGDDAQPWAGRAAEEATKPLDPETDPVVPNKPHNIEVDPVMTAMLHSMVLRGVNTAPESTAVT
jgi:hypothetical protein